VNQDNYERISALFIQAADLEGDAREAFLDDACQGDAELRRAVENLLSHDRDRDDTSAPDQLDLARDQLADAVLGTAPSPALPEQLGHYRINQKIGEGGMGVVYLAEQDHPHRRVALKMIRADTISPNLLKRFRFEAEVLGRLKHPGIAQIFEAGEIDTPAGRLPYFAMEYVEGTEFRRYAKEHDLNVREKLELVARIADAVHHAHLKGIVHRDLKPENVLVVEASSNASVSGAAEFARLGQPKVLDFGVARATDSDIQLTTLQTDVGQLVGTITYMSPEQVEGDSRQLDVRSDIYALGVLLYELLAGRPPFDLRRKSIPEAARIIREEEPTRLGSIRTEFRGDIDTIVCKSLEKESERRYASAAELAADLRRFLAHEPITAHPPSTYYELKKFARRHKGLVTGLALAFLILLAGVVSSFAFGLRAVRNEQRALTGEAAASRNAVRLNVSLALAIADKNPLLALEHLASVPPEHQGWEWQHIRARIDSHVIEYEGGAPCGSGAFIVGNDAAGEIVFATERNGAIVLLNPFTGEMEPVLPDASGKTIRALSADARRLVIERQVDKATEVWDIPSRSRVLELPAARFSEPVSHYRFSPDGQLLALRSGSSTLSLIEVDTGRIVVQRVFAAPPGVLCAFDPLGERIVCSFKRMLHLYSRTGALLKTARLIEGVPCLAVSPDGLYVAVGHSQRMISIYAMDTLELAGTLYGHSEGIQGLAFSPDTRYLASASRDGTVRVWDYMNQRTCKTFTGFRMFDRNQCLAFSKDSALLALVSDSGCRIWQWQQVGGGRTIDTDHKYIYLLAFSPDGSLIASVDVYGRVKLWDPLTGGRLASMKPRHAKSYLGFTAEGSRLITADSSQDSVPKGFFVYDPAANARVTAPVDGADAALFDILEGADGVGTPEFAGIPKSDLWGYGSDRRAFNREASLCAHVKSDQSVRVIDMDTGQTRMRIDGRSGEFYSVAFCSDGHRLAVGTQDGRIMIFDIASGNELARWEGHIGIVYTLAFSPDGSRIASGGNDGSVVLWDGSTFEQVAVFYEHGSYVHSVMFSPDGTLLASAGGDNKIRIWDALPPVERWKIIRQAKQLRIEAGPLVDRLLETCKDPLQAADRLRKDPSLDDDLRRAALGVLSERTSKIE